MGAINCGNTCSASITSEQKVTIMAIPDRGFSFSGFGGDTDCTDGLITMNANKTCTATFTKGTAGGSADCNGDTKTNSLDLVCVANKIMGL
jgi:hypothetical protein